MKLLVVSHSCIVGVNQRIYVELAKYRDVELRILVPRVWREAITCRKMFFDQDSPLKNSTILGDVVFPGGITKHFYRNAFLKTFIKFKPDIVFIDEEPQCLATFQFFLLARLFRAKVGFRIHENILGQWPFPFSKIESLLIKNSDYAFAVSYNAARTLAKKGYARKISLITHGVDSTLFCKRDAKALKRRLSLKSFVIGYVGVLSQQKGTLTLVEAIAKLKQTNLGIGFHLFMLGSGYLKQRIILLAKKLDIQGHLIIHERVSHLEIPLYLNCMDILVLPSITTPTWKEQFGRVLIEAMACEVPVIGSNSGEIPRIIENTGGGLIFQEGDAEDLKDKLVTIIQDRGLRKKLEMKGKKNVIEKYACSKVAEQLYQVFKKALDGRSNQNGN